MRFTKFVPVIVGSFSFALAGVACAATHSEPPVTSIRIADNNASAAASPTQTKPAKPFDVKNTFRNICGFCHEDYGRHAGKGPQLMSSERSDEYLFNRIKHGMPGRMPAWGGVFTDEQIGQIVKFIRSLKPGEEPQNPS